MVTARRLGRWALITLGVVVVVLIVLRVGVGIYLNADAGKSMVARKVEQQIGMPVEVTQVRVGLLTSTIGLKVFDPAAPDPSKAEVFAVDNADADISLFGIATGTIAPKKVTLSGVNLQLHVGADGKVITTLPTMPKGGGAGEVPAIAITDGRVTIRQDGRPEFALQHVNLNVEPNAQAVKLSGTIDDPQWSKWTVSGEIPREGKSGWVELATDDGPLTMDRLGSVPFVPPSVWEYVRPDGRGAAKVRLWADSTADVHYSVDIKPNAAALTLPDANATLTKVTGLIAVSGSKVKLTGARAELAGGSIAVDGDMDFGPEPSVMHLKVSAEKLDIKQLPAEWKLPKDFEGKLRGNADLTLRIFSDGRVDPEGSGQGAITDVKLFDTPQEDIPIRLHKAGRRYEFQQPKKNARNSRSSNEPVACAAPGQEKKPADPSPKEPPKTEPKKDEPKKEAPTTLDASIKLRDIEIAELLQKLNVKLDYKISGKVTAEATVAVPVTSAASQAAYRFKGKLTSPALTLEGLTIHDISADMNYRDGKFTLSNFSGKINQPGKTDLPAGEFRGTLSAMTSPPGDVIAELTIASIPLGEVLKALPDFKVGVSGTVGGKVTMKAPYEQISDPTQWSGSGDLTSSELVVEGRKAKDVRLAATVAKGVVTLNDTRVTLEGIPVTAEGTLTLSEKYPFTATVRTTSTDVTDLRKLVPEVEIPAPVEGVLETDTKVTGSISPLTFSAVGTIKASKLTLAKSTANHVEVKWSLTQEKLVVSELKAEAFGGRVTGSADVPFAADKGGNFEVAFKNLDAGVAAELVPDFPVKIAGKISGKVGGMITPAKPGQSRVGNLDVDITAPKLTVQGIPAERLAGKATIRNKTLEYELEGKTLGGSFEIKGRYPGQKKAPDVGGPQRGSFRLRGADLARIAPDVGFQSLAPLRGQLDASFEFETDLSSGSGEIRLTGLQWGNSRLAQEVVGTLTLRDGVLQMTNLSGRVAGGELRARGQVRLHDTSRNFFTVSLNGAEAKTLLAPFADTTLLEGPVTLVVHGRLGREMSGSGTITLSRGNVSGVQVTDLLIPFEFATSPGGLGQFVVHEASVSAGSGRARGEVAINWGLTTQVKGQIRFTELPIRAISSELGENALIGNGRITGRFDLSGTSMRSVNDLTGTLVATLNNTSVNEIPILRQATPFLNPAGLVKPFQSGDVRANLRNGVFHIQRLALANPAAQLFAEGTINTSGLIDLNVVAHTGTIGPESRALRLFGLRLPAVGPIPLTLIRDVSDFLSNRTVRLTITGTTSNPVVRVNVGALLSEQAVRFLLNRYLPAGVAGAAGLGTGFGSMNSQK